MRSDIAEKADFSKIRYAQCWEDADILLDALDIQPGESCLSIASAGDNTLAMLSKSPGRVIALDLNTAQLNCLELRVAAYRELTHIELLELIGSCPSNRRRDLYQRCRNQLSSSTLSFWDAHLSDIDNGIGNAGKFEHYFKLFRTCVLPLIHSRKTVDALLKPKSHGEQLSFYNNLWDNWRWRLLFRIFFSRKVMGKMGRDPEFFTYVEGSVADRILARTRFALTEISTSDNPYLQWILTGSHKTALPYALRLENFDAIRANLDKLTWQCRPLEDYLDEAGKNSIDKYNLSDIFEYMSIDNYHKLLERLVHSGNPGGRLAYWNMLAPRKRPESMAEMLLPLDDIAHRLFQLDKAFFYSDFVVEEIC